MRKPEHALRLDAMTPDELEACLDEVATAFDTIEDLDDLDLDGGITALLVARILVERGLIAELGPD